MARYREALCRVCRREGEKLFLKGDRCFTEKCGVERRKYPPGQHGQRRGKLSDYAIQLRAKQKVRNSYGLLMEKQFRKYFERAERRTGVTGEVLLQLLESRLDNVVYRMGFAANRRQARQLVGHGFFQVNGRPVNIPSYQVKPGDVVEVREAGRNIPSIGDSLSKAQHRGIPAWVELDADNFRGRLLHLPSREEIALPFQEQLIVELYSK
jgi:small subunit ribosomal protein S4